MPMRYALLVGVDRYLTDGTRKLKNGNSASLIDLNGCVNDIESIKELLEKEYNFEEISILSSPSHIPTLETATITASAQSPSRLPTFDNIKREFQSVYNKANSKDFFYFHFSGHGALLDRVPKSPLDREKDPSLMTADYCYGQPAVRGWQLNNWLNKLNQKGIHIMVSLDSCYSGGAWREDNAKFRTPENWTSVSNLPVDELVTEQEEDYIIQAASRTAEVETSWSINPEAFTLMTACAINQKAAERHYNGKPRGAFTYELLEYLRENRYYITYRMIRNHLRATLRPQTPAIYGRDRFLFLGNTEPFCQERRCRRE